MSSILVTGATGTVGALTGSQALDYYGARLLRGRAVVYANPSAPRFVRTARAEGLALPLILVMLGIYTTARLGLAAAVTGDTARLLGRPPTTLQRFVEEYKDCWI
jgi:hypothetical protein